jgi:hypothetical protein
MDWNGVNGTGKWPIIAEWMSRGGSLSAFTQSRSLKDSPA